MTDPICITLQRDDLQWPENQEPQIRYRLAQLKNALYIEANNGRQFRVGDHLTESEAESFLGKPYYTVTVQVAY